MQTRKTNRRRCFMSLIACTDDCVYQQDGCCSLERAASCATPGSRVGCVNFVARSKHGAERLPYVVDPDQLQPVRYGQLSGASAGHDAFGKSQPPDLAQPLADGTD